MAEVEEEDVPDQNPRFFVAVHVGVGFHMRPNEKALRSAMKRACPAAASVLRKGPGGCIDAVSAAIQVLEDDPKHKCWAWLNLTEDGHVECDANIMDGDSGVFRAVGVVPVNNQQVSRMVSNCCFVGQGTNVGVNTAGSNTSHLLGW